MVPELPQRLQPTVRGWLGRAGFASLTGGVLLFGYQAGFILMDIQLALLNTVLTIALLQAEFAVLSFAAFILASALVFLAWSAQSCPYDPEYDVGTVTAIVPVYRDANVLHRSVESLRNSNYEDVDVLVVCEQHDGPTRRRAEELAALDGVEYLVNTENPGSKAGAINYAVAEVDSEYVSVHDADELVDADFLPKAVAKLQHNDVVQGRTIPEPSGFIESLAYYESVLLSYVSRRVLYVFTDFKMAASRAVAMRRDTLESIGGYDDEMLTEDFYFAYQCYRERLDVAELLDNPSRIDAAHTITDWWGQRKRWMTGYSQVLHRLVATIRPVTDYRNIFATIICASTVVGSLLMLTMLSKFAVLLVAGSKGLFVFPLGAITLVTLGIHFHDYSRGLVSAPSWYWVFVPLLLPVYSLSAIKAVFEYVFSWSGEWYRVTKDA
ncbi:glycosyltransferase [Salinibaculum rarum]|uniref:glycosyltransferase n=1 Tax=Salinibaculum rarum TaxID=3058903 RepID=UPI00265E57F0|nr:glycosyltransferase family 2 protein [Salinibaculum sp. KK48]